MSLNFSKLKRGMLVLGAALTLPLGLVACGDDSASADGANGGENSGEFAGETISLAAVPSEESTTLETQYEDVIAVLEQELGVTVDFQNASDYAAVIEAQRAGQVDLASYGPFSYVIATDSGIDLTPLGVSSDEEGELGGYTSRAYKLADNDEISGLEDAAGREVCFVDAASTSGYLVPSNGLLNVDIDPEDDITPVMAGGHDASLLALDSGQCDIAFALDAMNDTLVDSGQLEDGRLEQIWESDVIPSSPIALSREGEVSDELAEALQETFINKVNRPAMVEMGICDTEEDCVLPEDAGYGFNEADDSFYDSIREICEVTQADACQQVG